MVGEGASEKSSCSHRQGAPDGSFEPRRDGDAPKAAGPRSGPKGARALLSGSLAFSALIGRLSPTGRTFGLRRPLRVRGQTRRWRIILMGRGSGSARFSVVRVLFFRSVVRSSAARLRCPVCVDGPVLDRVHVFLHVRPRFFVQFVHQSCCACNGVIGC